MHDDSVIVAVEAALSRPEFCICGEELRLGSHDGCVWLECGAFERPSRLPDGLALFVRELAHDRRIVVELPEAAEAALAA